MELNLAKQWLNNSRDVMAVIEKTQADNIYKAAETNGLIH